MALNKKESIQHTIQDGCQSRNVIWTPFIRWPPSWFFPKYAVYFKLHYFKLIHLQTNLLSSVISTFFAVNHTNLPQNCHLGLENTRFRT